MAEFEINLARMLVLPPRRRRALYRLAVGYLVLCGLAMIVLAYGAARRFAAACEGARQVSMGDRAFRQSHPEHRDVLGYALALQAELDHGRRRLEAIEERLAQRVFLAPILVGLCGPLPPGACLERFDLDATRRTLAFDIVLTVDPMDIETDAAELIARWEADPALMDRIADIDSVTSEREKLDGRPVTTWKFSCALKTRKV